MGVKVGLSGMLGVLEIAGLNHEFEDSLHIPVQNLHRETAVLDGGLDSVFLPLLTGLHHVVARKHGGHRIMSGVPVGHNNSLIAPVTTENGIRKVLRLAGVPAVEFVVGSHYSPWI